MKNNQKKKKIKRKGSFSTALSRIVLLILMMPVIIAIHPTIVFLFFGMLPTIIAFFLERNKFQYKWLCIGGFNISGVFYYLLKMWYGSHSIGEVFFILLDVKALILMYGSACFGILVYIIVPVIIGTITQLVTYKRISYLKNAQQKLIENWGEEIKEA